MSVTIESPSHIGRAGRPRSEKNDPIVAVVPKTVAAWAAGVVEGRGTIVVTALHGTRFALQMKGPQGKEVLNRLRDHFGGSIATTETATRWILTGSRITDMVDTIKRYLSAERLRQFNLPASQENEEKDGNETFD